MPPVIIHLPSIIISPLPTPTLIISPSAALWHALLVFVLSQAVPPKGQQVQRGRDRHVDQGGVICLVAVVCEPGGKARSDSELSFPPGEGAGRQHRLLHRAAGEGDREAQGGDRQGHPAPQVLPSAGGHRLRDRRQDHRLARRRLRETGSSQTPPPPPCGLVGRARPRLGDLTGALPLLGRIMTSCWRSPRRWGSRPWAARHRRPSDEDGGATAFGVYGRSPGTLPVGSSVSYDVSFWGRSRWSVGVEKYTQLLFSVMWSLRPWKRTPEDELPAHWRLKTHEHWQLHHLK